MIVEIFVAEHQPMNALTDELLNAVFDIALVTVCAAPRFFVGTGQIQRRIIS